MAMQEPEARHPQAPDRHAGESRIPISQRVFVNRNLKMRTIRAIGFDMDHTLAVYRKLPLETLAYEATRDKLVADKDYPEGVRSLLYDPDFAIRGLVVDKRLGNVLKIDQYNYVVRVYHGTRLLPREERKRIYRNRRIRLSSDKYMSIDTLFGLPEATLFAQLVDYFERVEGTRWRDYTRVYDDVRECIDRAHADDTIKREIVTEPSRFLLQDPQLAATLEAFRAQGKKLFLLTNSEAYYTQVVMAYLFDGVLETFPSWRDYFDVVVVRSGKPTFFQQEAPLLELGPDRLAQAGIAKRPGQPVYEGGSARKLEELLGADGDQILYMGDHTFGDILRAKKRSRWRTVMIVQELGREIELERALSPEYRELESWASRRNQLTFQQERLRRKLRRSVRAGDPAAEGPARDPQQGELAARLAALEHECGALETAIRERRDKLEAHFNPHWGKLFKCGEINSRFGHQVKDFACIYTSAVRNFLAYPESMYFRSPREIMPHEMVLDHR